MLEPNPTKPQLSTIFKSLSDPARLKILKHLSSDKQGICCPLSDQICACDLETLTGLSQPTVSHHMKVLTAAGLVSSKKRGRWRYYQIETEVMKELENFFAKMT